MYYAVVVNSPVLVYLNRRQMKMQQTHVQKYIFVFNAMYRVVLLMLYAHMKNKNMFHVFHWTKFCNTWQSINIKGSCVTWNFNIRISQQILYSRNSKTDISFATYAYSCNVSLWKRALRWISTSNKITWGCMSAWFFSADIIQFFSSNTIWILWWKLVLHSSISVLQTSQVHHWNLKHCHYRQCLIPFYRTAHHTILQQQTNTVKIFWNC